MDDDDDASSDDEKGRRGWLPIAVDVGARRPLPSMTSDCGWDAAVFRCGIIHSPAAAALGGKTVDHPGGSLLMTERSDGISCLFFSLLLWFFR